ncbi:hypothetical protein BJ973_004614 [Actinoplanes tereljensis]|uniref:Uncharacterized protein n=1 Tax=Paractinoplanes tereljensis TaxID=571912 RepID=A0A919NRU7_9ACTN|nr:hypothetical protein [Actinoplanes tereljensis]GIF24001.1 hypothetical protein Ate02nite_67310 [Actinoplanes tereljensis]
MDGRDAAMGPAERFNAEAIEQYKFLSEALGFAGPDISDGLIGYHSAGYSILVIYDNYEKSAITVVTRRVGDATRRAELSCLYASAGLGPAQDVKGSARTSRLVAAAIATQVKALKLVLPLLDGPTGNDLMNACHARY